MGISAKYDAGKVTAPTSNYGCGVETCEECYGSRAYQMLQATTAILKCEDHDEKVEEEDSGVCPDCQREDLETELQYLKDLVFPGDV